MYMFSQNPEWVLIVGWLTSSLWVEPPREGLFLFAGHFGYPIDLHCYGVPWNWGPQNHPIFIITIRNPLRTAGSIGFGVPQIEEILNQGQSTLDFRSEVGQLEAVRTLLDHGAAVDVTRCEKSGPWKVSYRPLWKALLFGGRCQSSGDLLVSDPVLEWKTRLIKPRVSSPIKLHK